MLMILPLPKKHPIIAGKIAAEQQQQTTTQKKDTIIHHQAPLTGSLFYSRLFTIQITNHSTIQPYPLFSYPS